ncbi:MAG TPA: SCO family protein [Longimicrobiaceae bacterium]
MQAVSKAAPEVRSKAVPRVLAAVAVALLLALAIAAATLVAGSPSFHATTYEPPAPARDFTLTDHTGGTTSLSDLRGKPVLLFFGYTHCPDVCPMTLSLLRDALRQAGAGPEEVSVLLVTVDPARDTPEILARYVERYAPYLTGLTGSEAEIQQLLSAYGIHAEGGHEGHSGLLTHTSAVFGIDRDGMIRVLLRPEAPRDEFLADVKTLLEL